MAKSRGQKLYLIPDNSEILDLADKNSKIRSQVDNLLKTKFKEMDENTREIILWSMKNSDYEFMPNTKFANKDILTIRSLIKEYGQTYKKRSIPYTSFTLYTGDIVYTSK